MEISKNIKGFLHLKRNRISRWLIGTVFIAGWVCIWFAGCSPIQTPRNTSLPASKIPAAATEAAATAAPTPATKATPTVPVDPQVLLESAIANLLEAESFEMVIREIRAYQSTQADGATRLIYGEFNTRHAVILSPELKVHSHYEYRYDPQADFSSYDSFSFIEDGDYFTRLVDASSSGELQEVDLQQIQPMAGDLFQTLLKYAQQAEFLSEQDDTAVYTLLHPHWYELAGAAGFADLGFLLGQENGLALVEQYVQENYPNVSPVRFTIYVSVTTQQIYKVMVDDSEFMSSVWAEVDRALMEQGADAASLTTYEVLDENGAEYRFERYNAVADFDLPEWFE